MCLIAIAHLVSPRYPFVVAANRDEDFERPAVPAHFWPESPEVLAGRDALMGGTWLAFTRSGRFAAVTNLRGAARRTKSRGFLVRDFVMSDESAEEYAERVARDAAEYAGFHLFCGIAGKELAWITPGDVHPALEPDIYAVSNAPAGEHWPKMGYAAREMSGALDAPSAREVATRLLDFLATPRGSGVIEEEPFVSGDRYGTRSSTVIVTSGDETLFIEQTFGRGGVRVGEAREFVLKDEG